MGRSRLLVAALAALALLGVPSVAHAAEAPEVRYAYSDFEGNTGVLVVGLAASEGVASIRADVKSPTGAVLASTTQFWQASGTPEDGVWTTAEPFQLDALGYYPVDVTVTDRTGVTTRKTDAGELAYVVDTFFDAVTVKPAVATYEKRSVVVTGALKGTWPGSGEVRRIPGVPVEVSAYMEWTDVVTGPDGRFTATLPIVYEDTSVHANYAYQNDFPYYISTSSDRIDVPIKPRATRVEFDVSDRSVNAGQPVTVTGTASWRTPAGWEPVRSGRIHREPCRWDEDCGTDVGPDGRFTATYTPSQTQTLEITYVPPSRDDGWHDPYVAVSRRARDVVVRQESAITTFTAARNEAGKVALRGHVSFPGHLTPVHIPVELQFSVTGAADWVTVGDVRHADWDGEGHAFATEITEPRSGYWRARYPGRPDGFQPAVSRKIYVT